MPEENTNQNAEQIKKLEDDLKLAFKEDKFEDAKQTASQIKELAPDNHLAEHMLEKIAKAEEKELKKQNSAKIKDLISTIKTLLPSI